MRNVFCEEAQAQQACHSEWSAQEWIVSAAAIEETEETKDSSSKMYESLTVPYGRGASQTVAESLGLANASFSQTNTAHIHGDPSSLRWSFLKMGGREG